MDVDYDAFRKLAWSERLEIFGALSAEEKAAFVRVVISRWLEAHRAELSAQQIAILEENVAFIRPELYVDATPPELLSEARQLEARTAELLSREQMRQALTMHW